MINQPLLSNLHLIVSSNWDCKSRLTKICIPAFLQVVSWLRGKFNPAPWISQYNRFQLAGKLFWSTSPSVDFYSSLGIIDLFIKQWQTSEWINSQEYPWISKKQPRKAVVDWHALKGISNNKPRLMKISFAAFLKVTSGNLCWYVEFPVDLKQWASHYYASTISCGMKLTLKNNLVTKKFVFEHRTKN